MGASNAATIEQEILTWGGDKAVAEVRRLVEANKELKRQVDSLGTSYDKLGRSGSHFTTARNEMRMQSYMLSGMGLRSPLEEMATRWEYVQMMADRYGVTLGKLASIAASGALLVGVGKLWEQAVHEAEEYNKVLDKVKEKHLHLGTDTGVKMLDQWSAGGTLFLMALADLFGDKTLEGMAPTATRKNTATGMSDATKAFIRDWNKLNQEMRDVENDLPSFKPKGLAQTNAWLLEQVESYKDLKMLAEGTKANEESRLTYLKSSLAALKDIKALRESMKTSLENRLADAEKRRAELAKAPGKENAATWEGFNKNFNPFTSAITAGSVEAAMAVFKNTQGISRIGERDKQAEEIAKLTNETILLRKAMEEMRRLGSLTPETASEIKNIEP